MSNILNSDTRLVRWGTFGLSIAGGAALWEFGARGANPAVAVPLSETVQRLIEMIGSGELERKLCAITSFVPSAERGLRGLKALEDTLGAVSARIAFARPIVRGPSLDDEVAELLRSLIAGVAGPQEP